MTVNSGSLGTTISFSDLQTFYGGTHPISLSEYYRGGSEVPSTQTVTDVVAHTSSGSGSGTAGVVVVTVSDDGTYQVAGGISLATGTGVPNSLSSPSSIIFNSNTAWAYLNYSSVGASLSWSRSDGSNGSGGAVAARGPAWQTGDVITTGFGSGVISNPESLPQLPSGGRITVGWNGSGVSFQQARHATRTITTNTRQNITFRNSSSSTINLSSSSTGGAQSIGSNITVDVQDGDTTNTSWTVSYPAVTSTENTNTNIPTSGESNLDQFNVPGNAAG